MRSRLAVCSMFAALALVAGACGAGESSASDGGDSLASFFGVGEETDPAAMEASWRDQEARTQEAIRTCMAAEGFDYIPVQQPEGSYIVSGPEDELEQRETMGFGITTWYDDDGSMGDGLDDGWEDPNQDIVEAMSDTEREAYYEALWGDMEDMGELIIDEETGDEYYESSGFGGGCEGTAHEEIYGSDGGEAQEELWDQLEPAFNELHERIEADERIVKAQAAYGSCMAEAGYEVTSQDELWTLIYDDLQERMDEIVGHGDMNDPFEGMSEEQIDAFFEESTQAEIDAFFEVAQRDARESIDRDALDALKQEEIEIAVADYHCSQDNRELYEEVSADYEAEFVANNRDLLEQLRDTQG